MPDLSVRKVTIFVSSPTDVMAERERAGRVIDRLQSRFREHVTIEPIFFEEQYYTADKSFQEQIPDAGESDLVVSIFWSKLGSELPTDLFGTMPDGKPYPGGAVYELMRALEARQRKNLPDVLVYRKVADTGISVTDPNQRRLMNAQLDAFETFWRQWFVSREGHFRAGFQTFHRPDDFEQLFEAHLRAWLKERGQLGKEVIWRIAERGSPYRGLEPYEPEHREVFFGREREIDRGRERLLAAASRGVGFLLVMGPSGAGKSSLARAGLVTRLMQPGDIDGVDTVRLAVMRPGAATTPQRALADALFDSQALPELVEGDFIEPAHLASALSGDASAAVAPILRSLDRMAARLKTEKGYDRPVGVRLLLVIDQLEELFSGAITDQARAAFVQMVEALARSNRVLIIATLRSSAYGALARDPSLMALTEASATLNVAVPGAEVLAEIVRRPAGAAGLTFERRGERTLDDELLAAAGDNADALPLLGFTLQWLFEHRDGGLLTLAAYDQLGGLEGAIGRAAEQAFASLDQDAQAALPQLLRGLAEISRQATGLALRDMPLAQVPDGTPLRQLSDALVAARVLLVHGKGDDAALRLAHDAVLRGWARASEIVTREQDFFRIRGDVAAAAQRWRSQQQRADLLLASGLPLAEAQTLKGTYEAELSPELLAFIAASSQREQQRQRRGYVLAGVFGLIALGAIGAGMFAWRQQQIAEEQTIVAEKQTASALLTQSRFLADLAQQSSSKGDAGTVISLALEALPDVRGVIQRPYAPEAEAALFSGWQRLRELRVLGAHDGQVLSAAFSPDGRRVVTASTDGTAQLSDVETGKVIAVLQGHEAAVLSAAFSPDGRHVLTASSDKTARVWDVESGKVIAVLQGHEEAMRSAAFSPDGRRVVTASVDSTARLWDAETGRVTAVLRGHRWIVSSAAFSPDGRRVVTASEDSTARVWDVETGKVITVLEGQEGQLWSGTFSSDGRRVVTAGGTTARLWDVETGKVIAVLQGHERPLQRATFSPDSRRVVTASYDKTARLWDVETGKVIAVLQGHDDRVSSAAFSPDGRRVVTASADRTARLWDVETSKVIAVGIVGRVSNTAFSPDGRRMVTAYSDKIACLWDVETGKLLTVLRGHEDEVWSAAFSPDGRHMVTASHDKTARVWDVETGKVIAVLQGHDDQVRSAAFSPDGRRVVTASEDDTARVWDIETGKVTAVLQGEAGSMSSAAFSPDGRRVVTAGWAYQRARVWDIATGKVIAVLQGHEGTLSGAAFSPDGRRVVTASLDKTARLWDAETGKVIAVLQGHNGEVRSAAFNPDGSRVVTASLDKTARLWDVATGKAIAVLQRYEEGVLSAAFSPNGLRVVTASEDGTAHLWQVPPTREELMNDAAKIVPRCLTREQREKAFLDPEPPAWCIEMEKWPYQTQDWKDWLKYKRANLNPPLPDSAEWKSWISARETK